MWIQSLIDLMLNLKGSATQLGKSMYVCIYKSFNVEVFHRESISDRIKNGEKEEVLGINCELIVNLVTTVILS